MKNFITTVIAIFLLSLTINAQGKKYSNKDHGYNFIAPAGWIVKEETGKCPNIVLSNSDQNIGIIVTAAHSVSLADFLKDEYKMLDFGYIPEGRIQENNGIQVIRLLKTQGDRKTTLDMVLMPLGDNDAIAVIALTGEDTYIPEAHNAVTQILKSVKLSFGRKLKKVFTDTEKALAAQSNQKGSSTSSGGSSPNSVWGNLLAGKKLEYFKNGSSRIFRFCGGGFSQNGESLNSSQNGYGSINTRLTGRWNVQGNTLILRYNDGETAQYDLSQGDDTSGVRLDGQFYAMTEAGCN